jgi:predicted RNA-binding Zn-ribbon protein involved in translation (DUF1610 family)
MTTIKATCPTCGEVSLTPVDIELRVDRGEPSDSSYAFTCPSCLSQVRKPADERIVRLLVGGGVSMVEVDSSPRFDWPPLTHDDLLDFHMLLQGDGWFDQLEGARR